MVVFAPCHQSVPGEAAVPADEDAHPGPAVPNLFHDPADVSQCFLPRVPVCRAQAGAEEMITTDGVVAVLPARHRNVPEWSLEETTARKDGR